MKFTVSNDALKDAARFVSRMAPARPSQPILGGVLINAEAAQGVTFTVFDYERSAETTVDATVDDGGVALVNVRLLSTIADKLPNKPVTVELDENVVRIKAGASRFTLPAMPVEEYPQVSFEAERVAVFESTAFEDAVSRVAQFVSNNDATPILGAVQVTVTGGEATFRATDRYRVAEMVVPVEGADRELLIPGPLLTEAAKSFTGRVVVSATDTRVIVTGDEGVMSSVMLTGNYPPLDRLFAPEPVGSTVVDTAPVMDAVGRCQVVVDRESPLLFEFSEGDVTISARADSSATETVTVEGDPLAVSLKPAYVLDGLKACRSEQARIEYMPGGGKPGPVLIHGGAGFRYLLQPNVLTK